MEHIKDVDDVLRYQEERVYDDEEDEDWWNEFCLPVYSLVTSLTLEMLPAA